jgi:hypothetical protein
MSGHTPGPWVAEPEEASEHRGIVISAPANGWIVATITPEDDRQADEIDWANARLIAEAPNLVDVLEAAHACFNGQHNLLSTATDDERKVVVENFLNWWNSKALPVLERIKEGG